MHQTILAQLCAEMIVTLRCVFLCDDDVRRLVPYFPDAGVYLDDGSIKLAIEGCLPVTLEERAKVTIKVVAKPKPKRPRELKQAMLPVNPRKKPRLTPHQSVDVPPSNFGYRTSQPR